MANRRAIVKRRKAVRNIKKITRTMQLIATARFQAALNRAVKSRPYTDKLAELVANLSRVAEDFQHPLMERHDEGKPQRAAVVVLNSNRGLAGGYNAQTLRKVFEHLDKLSAEGVEPQVHVVGKKGVSAFRFRGRDIQGSTTDIEDKPRYEQVEPLAQDVIDRFLAGEVGSVWVAYQRFYSAGKQVPEVIQLLPLSVDMVASATDEPETDGSGYRPVYEIRPSAEELLDELLPASVRMRFYQAFLDAAVSEQVFRMAAMKAATDAADDMISDLSREYNRARQTSITTELLDIVGGANALG
jgi:F-type H+-transporting ATPase subunit gamma